MKQSTSPFKTMDGSVMQILDSAARKDAVVVSMGGAWIIAPSVLWFVWCLSK
jgi:hypothetical protein